MEKVERNTGGGGRMTNSLFNIIKQVILLIRQLAQNSERLQWDDLCLRLRMTRHCYEQVTKKN